MNKLADLIMEPVHFKEIARLEAIAMGWYVHHEFRQLLSIFDPQYCQPCIHYKSSHHAFSWSNKIFCRPWRESQWPHFSQHDQLCQHDF